MAVKRHLEATIWLYGKEIWNISYILETNWSMTEWLFWWKNLNFSWNSNCNLEWNQTNTITNAKEISYHIKKRNCEKIFDKVWESPKTVH